MTWLRFIIQFFRRDPGAVPGHPRSPKWPSFSKRLIKKRKKCQICGSRKGLQVHHNFPYHIRPDLELVESNATVCCRRCHRLFAHLDDWACFNPFIKEDAKIWRLKIRFRRVTRKRSKRA